MNYGEILEKSWKIIWKNKILWIFGFFAGCLANGAGGSGRGASSIDGSNFNNGSNYGGLFNSSNGISYQIERFFESGAVWIFIAATIFALICLFFVFFIVSLILGTFGKTGLVRGAWLADAGQEKLSFADLWHESVPYFWRVFLLVILRWLSGIVLTIVLFLPVLLLILFTLGCGLCFLVPLLITLSWFITVLFEQSVVAVVGEDLGVMDGIKRGWQVLTSNLMPIAIMALILIIGSGIVSLLIGIPAVIVTLPIISGALIGENVALGVGIILSVLMLLVYIPIAMELSGGLHAYLGTSWTLVFRRLIIKETVES